MPRLDKAVTLKLIDVEFGITAARDRGQRPPNGVKLLSEQTGIPRRTLSQAVHRGDPIAEYRVVLIAKALNTKPRVLVRAEDKDPSKADEESAPKRETTGPPRRTNGKSGGAGPARASGLRRAS